MEPVRNRRNKIVVNAARLHRPRVRRQRGQTLIEGPNLLEEAVKSGASIDTVFALADDDRAREVTELHGLRLTIVDEGALEMLSGTETPRGPVSLIEIPEYRLEPDRDLLVAYGLSDPGNVGTTVRTAAAFGWLYAHTPGSADPWSPKALRAGAGGQFQTQVVPIDGIGDLSDWHTVATVVQGGGHLARPTSGPVAVVVGEEASGLSPEVVEGADSRVTIPMVGPADSLNVASAVAIVVYEFSKGIEHDETRV